MVAQDAFEIRLLDVCQVAVTSCRCDFLDGLADVATLIYVDRVQQRRVGEPVFFGASLMVSETRTIVCGAFVVVALPIG